MSEDIRYSLAAFLDVFDLRRLRIVSRAEHKVGGSIQICRRLASRIWPDWMSVFDCPCDAIEAYVAIARGDALHTSLCRQHGQIASNAEKIAAINSYGQVITGDNLEFTFSHHHQPFDAKCMVLLGSGGVVSTDGRIMHVCQDGKIAYMWLPGQIRYLASHGHSSWCCVTADGSTWLCRCHCAGTADERTHVSMISSPAQLALQGYAGVATCATCIENTVECWVGCTTGVYRTDDGQVIWVWQTCRILDICSSKRMVAAASAHDEIRVWDTLGSLLYTCNPITLSYYRLSAVHGTNAFAYGPLTIDAAQRKTYRVAQNDCMVTERRYTADAKHGVFKYNCPRLVRFVHIAT